MSGCVWPEQEAVEKWLDKNGLGHLRKTVDTLSLKKAVTECRGEVQQKLDQLLAAAKDFLEGGCTITDLKDAVDYAQDLYCDGLFRIVKTVDGKHILFMLRSIGPEVEIFCGTFDECHTKALQIKDSINYYLNNHL